MRCAASRRRFINAKIFSASMAVDARALVGQLRFRRGFRR